MSGGCHLKWDLKWRDLPIPHGGATSIMITVFDNRGPSCCTFSVNRSLIEYRSSMPQRLFNDLVLASIKMIVSTKCYNYKKYRF